MCSLKKKESTYTMYLQFTSNKWTFFFLEQEEMDFSETVARKKTVPQIADYVKVEAGININKLDKGC